ncbi:uncharacterized protein LOC124290573 [Haliotis rubra]|uniref:uncharacterized protein LOC124290573 n=1 Tax=Haliotis rubra TaxID=36100 RepID=UPI001EE6050B|nr:uncharacterized protein LOC124290573 [Haliotis rubra]
MAQPYSWNRVGLQPQYSNFIQMQLALRVGVHISKVIGPMPGGQIYGYNKDGVSEVVAGSISDSSQRALLLNDLSFASDQSYVEVVLRASKTDQQGRGTRIAIQAVPRSILCPVKALTRFLAVRPRTDGYFFIHTNSAPLTRFQFQAVLRKTLAAAKQPININLYSSHSFRIGAATTAALQGIPAVQIQEFGRWRSNAYQAYIRIPRLSTQN